jgi:hypothetical protein
MNDHQCDGTESECEVYHHDAHKEWVIDVPGGVTIFITYCPFCGVKLPEIKV